MFVENSFKISWFFEKCKMDYLDMLKCYMDIVVVV